MINEETLKVEVGKTYRVTIADNTRFVGKCRLIEKPKNYIIFQTSYFTFLRYFLTDLLEIKELNNGEF